MHDEKERKKEENKMPTFMDDLLDRERGWWKPGSTFYNRIVKVFVCKCYAAHCFHYREVTHTLRWRLHDDASYEYCV